MVPEEGGRPPEPRPARPLPLGVFVAGYPRELISSGSGAALAAGLGSSALPCVPLILANRSAILARSSPMHEVPEEGLARLSLAPRDVRRGVPQGAHFVREWGGPSRASAFAAGLGSSALPSVALILANRSAFLARSHSMRECRRRGRPPEPRPARPSAFAAGLGADALPPSPRLRRASPCVALFLLFVGAPRPFDPLLSTKAIKKG